LASLSCVFGVAIASGSHTTGDSRFARPLPLESGLGMKQQFGGWSHLPPTEKSPAIITIAKRA